MKRILLSVFAAAVTAAWAVPASATDVSFSGQYRVRGEFRDNADYNDDASDAKAFIGQRVRLNVNAEATDDTSVKLTLQDSRILGGSDSLITDTTESPDLHEAYLNVNGIFGTPVNFRIGRQELNYGDERLIGSFGWSNYGRAFDGVKFGYVRDGINVDLFRMTVSEATGVATSSSTGATTLTGTTHDTTLTGVYATLGKVIPNNSLDVYVLHQTDAVDLTRYTIGARVKGAVAGVDYTVELPYQTGETSGTVDISAWAFAAKAGYTLPTPMKIRVGAEYDFASGDEADSADENETFNNLYPTNHNHFGIGDVAVANSWSNIQAWSLNVSADVNEKLRLYAAYWDYTTDEAASGASDDIGNEIDLVASYKYSNNVSIEAGAARFTPGEATATTPDDAQDWAYLQITANF
ncbi:MAG TPA: hypothetical protein DDW94_00045 [Deltaproteobacteria bacterium]|nr:MAG: hypothetical protein A2Z79_05410 [Deltaproteobacteria bacterium GWA2_55_82]OIJ73364.1 MAG: hypothetical protein A2V21_303250 [Deltaproteobacteria bacterium GWC2_55_46]HBG45360.1 hypothetical protein [Deltaproteobacteria bacterium]HCY10191.1 hypothetical protein [Deltaproteobacteria bacterium]